MDEPGTFSQLEPETVQHPVEMQFQSRTALNRQTGWFVDGQHIVIEVDNQFFQWERRRKAMMAQMGQNPNLMGPQGGMVQPRQDPEQEAMKQYLMKAMMEAQSPVGAPPQGGAAIAPAGAGQSTMGQVRNRGRDLDAMIRQAGG